MNLTQIAVIQTLSVTTLKEASRACALLAILEVGLFVKVHAHRQRVVVYMKIDIKYYDAYACFCFSRY